MNMHVPSAQLLPRELLTIISDYLLNEDRFACIFVCRNWSIAFTPPFYQSVSIVSRQQCNLFYNSLLCSRQKTESAKYFLWATSQIGHSVRQISIQTCHPNIYLMRQLPELCPYLRRLSISDDALDFTMPLSMDNRCSRLLSYLLPSLCQMLPMLTGLTIVVREGLHSLSWITHLPKLTQLSIHCWRSSRIAWDYSLMDHIHRSNEMQQQGSVDISAHPPAPTLKRIHLTLPYRFAEYHAAVWLLYFARKYPNLTDVSLETSSNYSVYTMTYALEYVDHPMLTSAIETARLNAYRVFADGCRRVTRIQFKDLGLYRHLFHALCDAGHARLEHLGMDEMRNFPSNTLALCFDNFNDTLRSLKLQCTCFMSINLPWSLRRLTHLARLVLCGPYSAVPIDTLLDCCAKLEVLELHRVRVTRMYPQRESSPCHTSLKQLVLNSQCVSEPFLTYIGIRCQALEVLQMMRCFVTKTSKNGRLLVRMPHQTMKRISFQDISLDGEVHVVAVRMADHEPGTYHWFDLNGHRRNHRNQRREEEKHHVLGIMRSKQRGAVLKLRNHIMIECQSLGQLHADQQRLLL
ncbi:hypothetical protein BX666DRAFT_159207 [Dichotomocladium elegans]|nr:hypothetical protein BX666DRAFT_159207 [Dichotomocladium elegans]